MGAAASKKIGVPRVTEGKHALPGMRPVSRKGTSSGRLEELDMAPIEAFANCLYLRWMSVEQVVKEADSDNSGEIEWGEFYDLCTGTLRLDLSEAEIHGVFQQVDADGSGSVSTEELSQAIEEARKSLEAKMLVSVGCGQEEGLGDAAEVPDTKLVALVAHNNMKACMMAFVAKHIAFFKRVRIVTTGSTGTALEKKLSLSIAVKVASGPLGGDQEIGGMITKNEVAAAFFFIDPLSAHPHENDIRALTRICEVHNCACATNPTTGDALVHAFLTSPVHTYQLHKQSASRGDSDAVKQYKEGQQKVIASVGGG